MAPNPGSVEARELGCRCPIMDNGHGRTPPYVDEHGKAQWWISAECLMHWAAARPELEGE